MTINAYVIDGRVEVTMDNPRSVGVPPSEDGARWGEAMRDEAFVRDQEDFLEVASGADAELLDD